MKKILYVFFIFAFLFPSFAQDDDYYDFDVPEESISVNMSSPFIHWCVKTNLAGYQTKENAISEDAKSRKWGFVNDEGSVIITVFLEKTEGFNTAQECRDFYFNKMKASGTINDETIKLYDFNGFAVADYYNKSILKSKLSRNCNLYYSDENYSIDIHFSLLGENASDTTLFNSVINSFSLVKNYADAPADNLMATLHFAEKKDEKTAIIYLEEIVNAYKKGIDIDKFQAKVVLALLGKVYIEISNLEKCKKTLEYAISEFKEYPYYYYLLACAYAEEDNIDKTISNLQTAIELKNNWGMEIPKPIIEEESFFQKYLENPKFIELSKAFKE